MSALLPANIHFWFNGFGTLAPMQCHQTLKRLLFSPFNFPSFLGFEIGSLTECVLHISLSLCVCSPSFLQFNPFLLFVCFPSFTLFYSLCVCMCSPILPFSTLCVLSWSSVTFPVELKSPSWGLCQSRQSCIIFVTFLAPTFFIVFFRSGILI